MLTGGPYTATMGSFPLEDTEEHRMKVIQDLIALEIDFPNYPQLQDMGTQFLQDIEQGIHPPGIEPFEWTAQYLQRHKLTEKIRLKACITGPFTLSSYLLTKEQYQTPLRNQKLIEFTNLLEETCRRIGQTAHLAFIDEPILSLIFGRRRILYGYKEEDVISTYNRLCESFGNILVGTHICGRISPLLAQTLLHTDLDILSHEYHDTPQNFNQYQPHEVQQNEKTLAMGCVSTKQMAIESVEEIQAFMKTAISKYGRNIIFTPDCGFGTLFIEESKRASYKIAIKKLQNLRIAVEAL
jgi:5-methyltetrahydropteroyltriglutamate--homocysteine methyltransferase